MELRNLKTFQTAAKLLNFTKTAEILHMSQPAVTTQIKSLEQELNQLLFLRIKGNNYLTPAGEIVERYSDQIFSLIEQMEKEICELADKQTDRVVIAAPQIFCSYYLPPVISTYLKISRDVNIKIHSCHNDKVIRGIESGEYDIGIITGTCNKNGILNYVFQQEELVLVASDLLSRQYSIKELLEKFPLIIYNDNYFGYYEKKMKEFIKKWNLPVHKTIEMSSDDAIKNAALSHIGIALLTKNFVVEEIELNKLTPILQFDESLTLDNSLVLLEENFHRPAIKSFWDTMLAYWTEIQSK